MWKLDLKLIPWVCNFTIVLGTLENSQHLARLTLPYPIGVAVVLDHLRHVGIAALCDLQLIFGPFYHSSASSTSFPSLTVQTLVGDFLVLSALMMHLSISSINNFRHLPVVQEASAPIHGLR